MLPGKLNLAADQTGLSYTVIEATHGVATVAWGGTVERSPDAVLEPEPAEARSERLEAMDWLRERLSRGPVSSEQIKADARAAGLAWRTVRRAKDALGCRSKKDSFQGGWSWRLRLQGASLAEAAEDVYETPKKATRETGTPSARLDTFEEGEL
jgi:hypothetical protein